MHAIPLFKAYASVGTVIVTQCECHLDSLLNTKNQKCINCSEKKASKNWSVTSFSFFCRGALNVLYVIIFFVTNIQVKTSCDTVY